LSLLLLAEITPACNPLEVPQGPDLTDIAAIYDEPTGQITDENIEEAVNEALRTLSEIEELGNLDFVVQTLNDVGDAIRDVAKQDDGSVIKITAVTEVDQVCPGDEAKASVDPENGTLKFTVTVKDSQVEEVVWGDFAGCQVYEANQALTIDSSMDVYLGGAVPLGDLNLDSLLFRLVGEFRSSSKVTPIDLDFRIQDDALEIRIPALDGDVVFVVGQGFENFGIETSEGSFCCDFSAKSCFQLEGATCSTAEPGDKMISW